MTATADRVVVPGAATGVPPSSRVTFLVGDNHLIDLLLPAAVPLAKLAEPTRKTVNRTLAKRGFPELPTGSYVFARAAGMTMLTGNLSLAAQGVTDADLLAFVPASSAQRYEPNHENVSAALARFAKANFPAVSIKDARRVAVLLTLAALVLAGLLIWRMRWAASGGIVAPALFGGAALALAGASVLTGRLGAERFVSASLMWASVAALVATGATAPPGAAPGAPHAFLGAFLALAAAFGIARFTGSSWAAATTIISVSIAIIAASSARMFFTVPGQRIAVVMLVVALIVSVAAPPIGQRLAKVPRQSFASITGKDMYSRNPGDQEDTISPVEDSPDDVTLKGPALAEVAHRSNRVLTGVLLGTALVQLASTWCAIHPGVGTQWTFVVVAAMVALVNIMRARAFRDRRHAVTAVVGSALSLLLIPTHYGLAAAATSTAVVLWSAGAVLAIAVLSLLAGVMVPATSFSAPVRELAEYLEYVAIVVIIVFSMFAIGLIQFGRYH
ncbi:type VII secretion integral membrane protein EccD [Mycobacterium sp. CBMA293]|uniref:ESX-1 secretion system protein eccD1 n=2 Tax=unclassified Mycolicibacterium TaxID=2636767 RepID=A0A1S6GKR2_9MYCO|nr:MULTISPECIES: type VII secretion integral membrane protein EccD [unclassified Mycolicibacterium]AQS22451.1 ESX-1 secretion system protein eccD1 [Mycolicibacterium sp. CBMA 213]MUL48354.1 type VII secretion integral membrane protein EccD [Mycolicibacterium sp. CBMA 360]MUL62366.1 type VII secretion integral membrane protein EccD [Mycolicibacterium sp. CBMA 335]MUM04503.1 type VII secretion integral membrane protein EccD [Mycolicibacterium sp. CBMA 213]MUM14766.1 type VII secretion integral m